MSKFAERDRLMRCVVETACAYGDVSSERVEFKNWRSHRTAMQEAIETLRKHEAMMLEEDRFAPLAEPRRG